MNAFATAIIDNATTTTTENGAVTYSTSLNKIVDMFFQIAAIRGASYEKVVSLIQPAFNVDPELTFRVALWSRDVQQGAGERQTFRHILKWLAANQTEYAKRSIAAAITLGRADDVFSLLDGDDDIAKLTLCELAEQLRIGNGLVAKWMPRKGKIAARLRNFIGLSHKEYRQLLVGLTKVVETQMCEKKWDEINFSHVPSVAMSKYSKAFKRNAADEFTAYLERVKTGKANPTTGKVEKINTKALFPHDVITRNVEEETKNLLWRDLPDFVPEGISFLPIIDTSGSMQAQVQTGSNVTCMDVAVSLGIYLAEHNKSAFKDLWLNFHDRPKFRQLEGTTITEKVNNLNYHDWGGSTNLHAAMRLIVETAVGNNVAVEDMPNYLLVLSDMEFNNWGNQAPGKQVKDLFEQHGYKMPNIVWWNIQSRHGSTPVRADENGMALVSGFSPSIIQNLLSGEITPEKIMLNTIMNDRYSY